MVEEGMMNRRLEEDSQGTLVKQGLSRSVRVQ